jgi:hypothetical protein
MTRRLGTALATALLVGPALTASAQELEPRRYVNAPTGVNFAALAYGFASGNVLLDPSLPIEGLDANLHSVALRYVRTLGLFGKGTKVNASLPLTFADWSGTVASEFRTRSIDGFGDITLGIDMNLVGGPALSRSEFASHRSDTIVGVGLQVRIPSGQYDPERLLNLGTNRWTFVPQVGVSHVMGAWTVEAAARAWLFTVNDDFFGGNRLEQRPLVSVQLHGVYTVRPGLWLAAGIGGANGGRSVVNDIAGDTLQQNSRVGFVFAYPLTRSQGLRLALTTSLTTSSGSDFRTLGVAWQRAW